MLTLPTAAVLPLFALFTGAPGWAELLIVLAVLLILFGNRLPSVMRSLGQGITEFKKGVREENSESARLEDSDR
ncbi:MAG: twin-arginine translocase TatA/TatE family subunit [Planctomycetota bacterium]